MNAITDRAPVNMLARMGGILERARNDILAIALVCDTGSERTRAEVLTLLDAAIDTSADALAEWGV